MDGSGVHIIIIFFFQCHNSMGETIRRVNSLCQKQTGKGLFNISRNISEESCQNQRSSYAISSSSICNLSIKSEARWQCLMTDCAGDWRKTISNQFIYVQISDRYKRSVFEDTLSTYKQQHHLTFSFLNSSRTETITWHHLPISH